MLEEKLDRIVIAIEQLLIRLGPPEQPVEGKIKKGSTKKEAALPPLPPSSSPAVPPMVIHPPATREELKMALMRIFQRGVDGQVQAKNIVKTHGGANSSAEIPDEKIALCMAEAQKILKGDLNGARTA